MKYMNESLIIYILN